MSDDEFDEESFATYENELYGDRSDSDNDIESDIEDALYSQVHYSFSLPDEDDPEQDKDDSECGSLVTGNTNEIVESGKHAVITISDDDDDIVNEIDRTKHTANVSDDSNNNQRQQYDAKNRIEEDNLVTLKENWDLIDKDKDDETIGGKYTPSRYYAPGTKNANMRCRKCNERGHLVRDCTVVKKISCSLCGTQGHRRVKCPNQLCYNCFQPGHRSSKCQQYRVRWNDQCRRCFQNGHHSNACPDIWRQYHRTTVDGIPPIPAEKPKDSTRRVYCYNCSAKGHYGHECLEERPIDRKSSTFQYIVRYDNHHFHSEQTPRNDNRKRQHNREKREYATPKHYYNERKPHSDSSQYDRQREEYSTPQHSYIYNEREANSDSRQYDRQREAYSTPQHSYFEREAQSDSRQRQNDREREEHITPNVSHYERRMQSKNRKRQHEREREDYITPKHRKKGNKQADREDRDSIDSSQFWPRRRGSQSEGYSDYIAGRVKDGNVGRHSEPLDFMEDVPVPEKFGSKKKKRNKKKKLLESSEPSSFDMKKATRKEKKLQRKNKLKNKEMQQSAEYFDGISNNEEVNTRTVEFSNPRERSLSDTLLRIVDDWEEMNDKQKRGNFKSKIKRKKPIQPTEDRFSLPGFSNNEQRLVSVPPYGDSLPDLNFRGRGINSTSEPKQNFLVERHFQKWPKNNKTYKPNRGFRSKKKKNRTM